MSTFIFRNVLFIMTVFLMSSCTSEDNTQTSINLALVTSVKYEYNTNEIQTMDAINEYRLSVGLNVLEKINYVSVKSEEHSNYMVENKVVNHNNFTMRSDNIIKYLGAASVGENIAYNYNSGNDALKAWLKSSRHKENIEGDFTHFGIAIKKDPISGKKYYTNIFVKI